MADITLPIFENAKFYVSELQPEDPGIITDMSDGSQTSRPQFTKSRLTFLVSSKMFVDELTVFLNFYRNTIKGCSQKFTWINPDKNSPYYNQTFTVRMLLSQKPQKVKLDYWQVEFILQEA
jgi:hypothetical protein